MSSNSSHRTPVGLCTYCASPAQVFDHYIPRCVGGSDHPSNLVPACAPCNMSKGPKLPWFWAGEAFTDGLLGGPEPAWEKRIMAVVERSPEVMVPLLSGSFEYDVPSYRAAALRIEARAEHLKTLIGQMK